MKKQALAAHGAVLSALVALLVTGCAENAPTLPEQTISSAEAEAMAETSADVDSMPKETVQTGPVKNEDGSYTCSFSFPDQYLSTDFAGIDVLDSTPEYPRERFEDVFMYCKGAYLNNPDVPADFFNEWFYTCAAEDCKIEGDPNFGFSCAYIKNIDGKTSFILRDKNYGFAVRWDKGQILYDLWSHEIAKIKCDRRGYVYNVTETKEVLTHNDLIGANAKEIVDSFEDGLYDKVLSTLSDRSHNAYTPIFHFNNGALRASNSDEDPDTPEKPRTYEGTVDDGIVFEFYLPDKGMRIFSIIVDRMTGRIYGTLYRTLNPGEDFFAYPAGMEWG